MIRDLTRHASRSAYPYSYRSASIGFNPAARQAGQGSAGGFVSGAGGSNGVAGGGSGAGRAFTVQGTIKNVDGDTLTITLGNRDVKVNLSDKTQLLKSVAGSRDELAAGAHVMITPEGSATGGGDSLNAASVTILPSQ